MASRSASPHLHRALRTQHLRHRPASASRLTQRLRYLAGEVPPASAHRMVRLGLGQSNVSGILSALRMAIIRLGGTSTQSPWCFGRAIGSSSSVTLGVGQHVKLDYLGRGSPPLTLPTNRCVKFSWEGSSRGNGAFWIFSRCDAISEASFMHEIPLPLMHSKGLGPGEAVFRRAGPLPRLIQHEQRRSIATHSAFASSLHLPLCPSAHRLPDAM